MFKLRSPKFNKLGITNIVVGIIIGFMAAISISSINKIDITESISRKTMPFDLFARSPGGTCIRLVTGFGCPSACFQVGGMIGATSIISTVGVTWSLWDNAACNTTFGGMQVSFL